MTQRAQALSARLDTLVFNADSEAHIKVETTTCTRCEHRPCVAVCPGGCYEWNDEDGQLVFSHDGCLECGSCQYLCDLEAIEWAYPRKGRGVRYRWG